ncbi:MAG: hypothetical protein NTX97_01805 [Bacteroidetes bacterium]|nr:hypothetical protein [Bacteroidota bacterium]
MKPLTILFAATILIVTGCKKKDKETAPIPASAPTAVSYDSVDVAISGKWVTDSVFSYQYSVLTYDSAFNDPTTCYIDLKLTAYSTPPHGIEKYKECIWASVGGGIYNSCWMLDSGDFYLNSAQYHIASQTDTTLEIEAGSITGIGYVKYFFHRE